MKSFISCLAASLILSVTNFALAEQVQNFATSTEQITSLPSELTTNELMPVTAGKTITVINHSNRRVCITIVEASPLQSRGWYIIENGAKRTFYSLSYIRAEECGTGGAVYWNPGWDMQYYCLKYGPAFNFYTPGNASMCKSLGGIMKIHYRIPSNFTWTLNW